MGLPQVSSSGIAEEVVASFAQGDYPKDPDALNGWLSCKTGQEIQKPVPRIVGFETRDGIHSPSHRNGSLIRKRLLYPLNGGVLHSNQFDGGDDAIDNGQFIYESDFGDENGKCSSSSSQEHKKAHIGDSNGLANSNLFTDGGPLFENKMLQLQPPVFSTGRDRSAETTKQRYRMQAITIPAKKAISPPLSPLGPHFTERMKSAGECKEASERLEDNDMTVKDQHSENLKKRFDMCRPEELTSDRRRPLVGSFEESLLSGRLVSKSQKLPFGVTSVDGKNYLLYYSSINLAGNGSRSKSRSPKAKRSHSVDSPFGIIIMDELWR